MMEIAIMEIEKHEQGLITEQDMGKDAVYQFSRLENIEQRPIDLTDLYTFMRRTNMFRFDPRSSYAKQILDILGEILSDILSHNSNFLSLLISPTPENLRDVVTSIIQTLTKPISIPQ